MIIFVSILQLIILSNSHINMKITGYVTHMIYRPKTHYKAKTASGGMACFIREDRFWLRLQAKFFGLEKDIFVCFLYISPELFTHESSRNNIWNALLTETAKFSAEGSILLVGDFNARSGTLSNYVTNDSPTHLPLPPEYTSDEVWLRVSEDEKVNNYGKELIDLGISSRLRIMNGRIGMDKGQGVFTCVTPRGSSVVDYSVRSLY